MSSSYEYLDQQSTAFATNCERRPFLCTVIQFTFLSFGVHPSFWECITCFSLSLFKVFYVDSLLLVQVKQKWTLYRFYY